MEPSVSKDLPKRPHISPKQITVSKQMDNRHEFVTQRDPAVSEQKSEPISASDRLSVSKLTQKFSQQSIEPSTSFVTTSKPTRFGKYI